MAMQPKEILAGMQTQEWNDFITKQYPMLQTQASKLNTLSTDYYNNAMKNTSTVLTMQQDDRAQQQAAMGISPSGQDAMGQSRYDSLTATAAKNSAANTSVDDANKTKQTIADNIMGIQTNLKNQAIADAGAASGMQTSRTQQGIANKAQDQQQTMQGIGTIVSIGAMAF